MLAEQRRLARGVRAAQRVTWFALLVLAAVTVLAIPVYRFGDYASTCRTRADGGASHVCIFYSAAGLVYWPVALVLAYFVIAGFYLRHARSRGVGARVLPYVISGAVLAASLGSAAEWVAHHPPAGDQHILGVSVVLVVTLVGPMLAIGLALLVLAVVERNRALLLLAVVYLILVLLPPADLGWAVARLSPWYFLPRLVIGCGVLLLAGLGFARVQRPRRRASP